MNEVDKLTDSSYVVIEVSSHTLEFVKTSPHIGILLNIYPEHLDHVNCIDDYIRAKFNIAKHQKEEDYFIYNAENKLMTSYNFKYKENDIGVYLNSDEINIKLKNKVYLNGENIYFNNKYLMSSDEPRKIKGMHTLNNMMFILGVSMILNLNLAKTIESIKNVEPLEHRMEYVGKFQDIIFYNDAIATIPEATINCINTLEDVDTLICGGMDRGIQYDSFIEFLKFSKISNIICMPETGEKIFEELKLFKRTYRAETIEEAVNISKEVTKKGKICLLSPAASSYNCFKNFEEKGKLFKKYVKSNIK